MGNGGSEINDKHLTDAYSAGRDAFFAASPEVDDRAIYNMFGQSERERLADPDMSVPLGGLFNGFATPILEARTHKQLDEHLNTIRRIAAGGGGKWEADELDPKAMLAFVNAFERKLAELSQAEKQPWTEKSKEQKSPPEGGHTL